MSETALLAKETEYFEQHEKEFLRRYPEKFLLIHDQSLVGTYSDEQQAVSAGIRKFGTGPFLVRKPGEEEHVLSIPAYSMGLL